MGEVLLICSLITLIIIVYIVYIKEEYNLILINLDTKIK